MKRLARILTPIAALMLAACNTLTAEQPLFAPADQIGPPPLLEGVWVVTGDQCPQPEPAQTSFDISCTPFDLRRTSEGGWRISLRADFVRGGVDDADIEGAPTAWRLVIVPATERVAPNAFAPLYVAEMQAEAREQQISYAVIAPAGVMPAAQFSALFSISCDVILREGAIEGIEGDVSTQTQEPANEEPAAAAPADGPSPQTEIESLSLGPQCIARTQAAVREAARRLAIEEIDALTARSFVRVAP